jgi:hypothetical protein
MPSAPQAIPQQSSPTGREAAISAISAAMVKLHPQAARDRPKWFWHLLHKSEAKARAIAEQATQSPYSSGDATFIEVFAKSLPALFTEALERLDEAGLMGPEPD